MRLLRWSAAALLVSTALSTAVMAQSSSTPASASTSQTTQAPATATTPEAKPEDVKSPEALLNALYDVISGPAGARDWNRFHSLFVPEGRLVFNGVNAKGEWVKRVMTADDYQKRAGEAFMKEGFFERGVSNKFEQFGAIAQVFTTYESRHEKDGQPFARGINSMQFVSDGHRWYVLEIVWDQEKPNQPIPEKYLQK